MQDYKNQIEAALRQLGAPAQLATSLVNTSPNFVKSAYERQRPAAAIANTLWNNHNK